MAARPKARSAKAAIFDLDGLLLDTEPLYLEATRTLLARYGRELDASVLRQHIGLPSRETMERLASHYDLDVPGERLHAERLAVLDITLPSALPRPGARELTMRLHEAGVPIAIGTSSTRVTLRAKMQRYQDWLPTFDAVVTSDDVERGKPHPDIFLAAARDLDRPPADCVVFEDARAGVEAARAAGMPVVMVPTDGVDTRGLDPDEMLDSLIAFDPVRWGLI